MTADNPVLIYAMRLGDDALIAGHRLSEWCGNAPMLEEELALANTSLDFLGRARLCYGLAADLAGDGRGEDWFAYQRDCRAFTNHLIHELPRGDFAFTMARQFLIDALYLPFLEHLAGSIDPRLAAVGATCVKESTYHLRRSRDWMMRLGHGTEESHDRLQRAIDDLWGYTPELFDQDPVELELARQGVAVDMQVIKPQWTAVVADAFSAAAIATPSLDWRSEGGRKGLHSEHLGHLLAELQFMQRAYPGLEW